MSRHFRVPCPECDRPLRVREEHVGQQVRCKKCEHVFRVPKHVPIKCASCGLEGQVRSKYSEHHFRCKKCGATVCPMPDVPAPAPALSSGDSLSLLGSSSDESAAAALAGMSWENDLLRPPSGSTTPALEAAAALQQLAATQAKLAEHESQLRDLQEQLAEAQEQHRRDAALIHALEEVRNERDVYAAEVERLREEEIAPLAEPSDDLATSQAEIARLTAACAKAEQAEQDARAELEQLRASRQEAEPDLDDLLGLPPAPAEPASRPDLEQELQAAVARADAAEEQLAAHQELERELQAAQARASAAEEQLAAATSAHQAAAEELERTGQEHAAERDALNARIEKHTAHIAAQAAQIEERDAEFESLRGDLASAQALAERLQAELESAGAASGALTAELESLHAERTSSATEVERLHSELLEAQESARGLTAELESLRAGWQAKHEAHEQLQGELAEAHGSSRALTTELESLRAEWQERHDERARLETELEDAQSRSNTLTSELDALRAQWRRANDEHELLHGELQAAHESSSELAGELEALRFELQQVNDEREHLRNQIEGNAAALGRLDQSEAELTAMQMAFDRLRNDHAGASQEVEAVRAQLAETVEALASATRAQEAAEAALTQTATSHEQSLEAESLEVEAHWQERQQALDDEFGTLPDLTELALEAERQKWEEQLAADRKRFDADCHSLRSQVDQLCQELESHKQERDRARQQVESLTHERDRLAALQHTLEMSHPPADPRTQAELNDLVQQLEHARSWEVNTARKNNELAGEVKMLQGELDRLRKEREVEHKEYQESLGVLSRELRSGRAPAAGDGKTGQALGNSQGSMVGRAVPTPVAPDVFAHTPTLGEVETAAPAPLLAANEAATRIVQLEAELQSARQRIEILERDLALEDWLGDDEAEPAPAVPPVPVAETAADSSTQGKVEELTERLRKAYSENMQLRSILEFLGINDMTNSQVPLG